MFDLDNWQEIWTTITRNKLRSILTAFGVFWGIYMLVVMAGMGNGIQNKMIGELGKFSVNSTFVFSRNTTEPYAGFAKGREIVFNDADFAAVIKQFPELEAGSAIVFGDGLGDAVRGEKHGTYRTMGYAPGFYEISPCRILQGRYLNEVDISDKRKVCVIGKKVANDLYAPNEDVLGSIIRIGSIYWQVIGVYEDYSEDFSIFGSPNQMIYVPVSTLKQMRNMGDKINFMGFKAYDAVNMSELEPRILSFLKERKSVSPTDNEGVGSFSLKEMFDNFSMLFGGINTLIWIVGLGTLLAGMVGVSNIMLVTVRERTQEIGIRRALGATPMVIIKQIMSESVVLASISGFIGIAAGVGTLVLVQWFLETFPPEKIVLLNPQVSFITAVAAVIVLIVSGLLAGLLPSKRALQIKAIEALYDE